MVHGGQYLPAVVVVPDPGEPGRDEVLAQVARLREHGRTVIALNRADEHLALDELVEVFTL